MKFSPYVADATYDRWKELVLTKLNPDTLIPHVKRLVKEDETGKVNNIRAELHKRASKSSFCNLETGEWETRKPSLLGDYKNAFAIGQVFNALCPLVLNLDTYTGGFCYGCLYCFAKVEEQTLCSAFYDNFNPATYRKASPKIFDQLRDYLAGRGTDDVGLAFRKRIPLRFGNRDENFLPIDKTFKISLKMLSILADADYPTIVNTKSDLFLQPDYWKVISEHDNIIIQESIITSRDEFSRKLEPYAPLSSQRFKVIKACRDSGMNAIIRSEPLIFGISTPSEHLHHFAECAVEANANYVNVGTYNLCASSYIYRKNFENVGFDFDRILDGTAPIIKKLVGEKGIFIFNEHGIRSGSFNSHNHSINAEDECCGVTSLFKDKRAGRDGFSFVQASRFVISRGRTPTKWADLEKWALPHYGQKYYDKMKMIWNNGIANSWQGDIMSLSQVGGIKVCGYDDLGNAIYFWDERNILDELERLAEVVS